MTLKKIIRKPDTSAPPVSHARTITLTRQVTQTVQIEVPEGVTLTTHDFAEIVQGGSVPNEGREYCMAAGPHAGQMLGKVVFFYERPFDWIEDDDENENDPG